MLKVKYKNKKGERPTCTACGSNPVEKYGVVRGKRKDGSIKWKKKCCSCRRSPHTILKKDVCECCGFVPVHRMQLDVDHIDGDRSNTDESNLQTLCANCHRLKTYLNRDWEV